uniref:Uncharacterized protein n=1 Tax=Oryzias melastigma TaxID=30732 RepID=A0A3B3CFS0_ORYME
FRKMRTLRIKYDLIILHNSDPNNQTQKTKKCLHKEHLKVLECSIWSLDLNPIKNITALEKMCMEEWTKNSSYSANLFKTYRKPLTSVTETRIMLQSLEVFV